MRNKIIVVNAIIIAIVGVLAFVMTRTGIINAASNTSALLEEAKHDALGAGARLQVDGLKVERWLTVRAADPASADPLDKADESAAGRARDAGLRRHRGVREDLARFRRSRPVARPLTDANGMTIGRNGSELRRGEDLSATYPVFKAAIQKGQAGSDVWSNKVDSVLASYAPIRNERGQVIGALIVGIQLSDELSRVADSTTGRPLVLAATDKAPCRSSRARRPTRARSTTPSRRAAKDHGAMETVHAVLDKGHVDAAQAGDVMVGAAPLESLGDGKSKVIVATEPAL